MLPDGSYEDDEAEGPVFRNKRDLKKTRRKTPIYASVDRNKKQPNSKASKRIQEAKNFTAD